MPRTVIRDTNILPSENSSNPSASVPPADNSSGSTSYFRIVRGFFSGLWWIIRTIWYWLERVFLILFLFSLTIALAWWISQKPSLYRDWATDQSLLPEVSFSGNLIHIRNARDFQYQSTTDYTPHYYDRTYNLDEIEEVRFIIVPFGDFDGPAHTMLSFTFSGGVHVVVSPEIRKERGEEFDAVRGVLNQYEMVYMVGSEGDFIKLRTNYRKNEVYFYPIDTPKDKKQALFRSMMIRADKLAREPEFYNTFWNNCSSSLFQHTNALRQEKLGWNISVLLPYDSDIMAYNARLIQTKLPYSRAREYYRIDQVARSAGSGAVFSEVIRKPIE